MVRVVALSLALTLLPVATTADGVPANPERCRDQWPSRIRVHLIHKRGSSVPSRVITMPFDEYVGAILASGAAPAHKPMAALRAMAVVVAARSHWFVCHPQPGYTLRGQRYDIHSGSPRKSLRGRADAGQYLQPGIYVHSRIRRAVSEVRGVLLRRGTRMAKPQWTGGAWVCGAGYTGNRLPANGAGRCARQGRMTAWIIERYLPRVRVIR